MDEIIFIEELKKINIKISDYQLKQLNIYYNLLKEWNQKINLTKIIKKEDVYLKHFYDSLTLTNIYKFEQCQNLCDVGTGAGFPGIVLKIIFPHLKVTLIESIKKKIFFLTDLIKKLKLNDVEIINKRVEEYGKNNREKYDLVVVRALANFNIICELCLPLVKEKGYFIAMKSQEKIKKDIPNKLGGKIIEIKELFLPYEKSLRKLIKIKKIIKTNKKYPRPFSQIKNKPL